MEGSAGGDGGGGIRMYVILVCFFIGRERRKGKNESWLLLNRITWILMRTEIAT